MSDSQNSQSNQEPREEPTKEDNLNSNQIDQVENENQDLSSAIKTEEKPPSDDKLTDDFDNKLTMTPNTNQSETNSSSNNANNSDNAANASNLYQTETPNTDNSLNTTNNTPTTTNQTTVTPNKIEILLKAVGNAPILKNKKFLLERTKNVNYIIGWLKKYMKLDPKDQLFLYVNQEFAPSPDAEIGTIYDCFKIGNTVIFHYCITPAWG